MKRLAFVLLVWVMFLTPRAALALTEEEARARIEKLNDDVSTTLVNKLTETYDPGIYIWSKKTDRDIRFNFGIRTHVGRPIPYLYLRTPSEKPLDVSAMRITNASMERRRGRVKGGVVEFKVPTNGVVRSPKYSWFWGLHMGYKQMITVKLSVNEELDKLANIAWLCKRGEDATVELKGPIVSETITLSKKEKEIIADMWDYFEAYAFLAETYHVSPEAARFGRYTEEGYDAQFLDILAEFGLEPPKQEEPEVEEGKAPNGAPVENEKTDQPEKGKNKSLNNPFEKRANFVMPKHDDARPMAVTEVPLAANQAIGDSFQQRKLMAEHIRLAEESKKVLAEQERVDAEIQSAQQERERQLEAERVRLIEEQNKIFEAQAKAEAERKAAFEEAERQRIAAEEKTKAEAQKAAEEAAAKEERRQKEIEQNIKDNADLINRKIELYWEL